MDSRKDGRSQAAAAARAGFSERTGRRIDDPGYVRKDQAETNVLFELIAEGVSGISCVVGHDGSEGARPCRDASHLLFLAILDQLLAGADAKTAFDPDGLLDDLKKALAERVLNAEMDHHLAGEEPDNRRNGYGRKTVLTDTGKIALGVPRDRQSSFDPQLIAKYQRCFPGFDNKIISMYASGMIA